MEKSLDYVLQQQKEMSLFGGIGALLGWDQMTYMPSAGIEERSEQAALISRLAHEQATSEILWNHLTSLTSEQMLASLDPTNQLIIHKLYEDIEKARKVPTVFVEKIAKTTTLAYQAWETAREKNDFKLFASPLSEIINLEKEYCSYIDLPGHPYNSLLDDYEEGMTVDVLRKEFTGLKKELVHILEQVTSSATYERQQTVDITLSVDQQKQLSHQIITAMGLPENRCRLDISTHPFTTTIGYDDVRITTSYKRPNPLFSLFSTIHEAGHALYELGMPQDRFKDTVISDAPSLGLHESQSRFWENMIARSKPFSMYFSPVFQQASAQKTKTMPSSQWYQEVNQVQPSLIRVEADELTYCLHVILRFELELMLLDGEIKVSELPSQWNEKMNDFLGIRPKTDVEGVLQDMHWSGGSFGYFPTYAIGTIYAAQLFKQLLHDHPETTLEIEQGKFSSITTWLRDHVHRYGRMKTADEIIKQICGEGLNSKVFVAYLQEKYYSLYKV
jgi:carboxypeptidase Taq